MGLWDRTAVNVGWTATAQVFSVVVNQAILLVLAHILDTFDFGVYAACTVVNALLVQLTTLSLDYAVIHSRDDWKRVLSNGAFLRIMLTLAGFLIIVALSGVLEDVFDIKNLAAPLILASSSAVVLAFAFPPQMQLTKNLQFRELSIARIAGSATWSSLALVLAILGWTFWSLIVALVLSQLAILISVYVLSPQKFAVGFDKATSDKLIRFGGVTAAGFFLAFLAVNLDKFIVGSVIGPDELGIYWAMFIYGTTAPNWLTGIINSVMFPTYTLLRDRPESLRKAYSETLRFVSEFSSVVSMGLAGGSAIFVMTLLGGEWEPGIESLAALSLAGFFMSLTAPAANVYISVGRPDLIFKITLAFLIPMVPLMVMASYEYGILGVSAVVLGHEGAKCAYVVHTAGRIVGAPRLSIVREIVPSFAAGTVAGSAVLLIYALLGSSILTLVLAVLVGTALYLVLGQALSKGVLFRDIREGWRIVKKGRREGAGR